ncbi:MAG TPA: GHMP kinase [Chloroflexi bacterium]|nr:GHMP kinase [Chloroflexota bacterium]
MIIVQTPVRVSFFGGGTDFPSFYRQEGGCVLSTAIDKYIFVTIKERRFDDRIWVSYTRTQIAESVDEVQHELIREAMRLTGTDGGVEITTMGDVPAGTGLGSSGTVTVGALNVMYAYQNRPVTAETLARQACQIELEILKHPGGVQDEYIAAYGGLRFMEFRTDGEIRVESVRLPEELKTRLNENLLLFYTGMNRRSETILDEQENNVRDRLPILRRMKEIAVTARRELEAGHLDALGVLLDESWELKKQLASRISNGDIDEWYRAARQAGALGGKITGAGGGGFFLLYVPYERRQAVRQALSHLREMPFHLEPDGSKVIFNYRR